VSFELSLLERVTVMPPGGAALVRNRESRISPPGGTFESEDNVISAANAERDKAKNSIRAVRAERIVLSPKVIHTEQQERPAAKIRVKYTVALKSPQLLD
jgi:hypothetical protein